MGRDWQQEQLGFSFADPWFLLLVPLVILVWIFVIRRKRPALGFPSVSLVEGLPSTLRTRLRQWPRHLLALGLIPICVAIARPQRLQRLPLPSEGIDILLCLDLSSSMSTRDMDSEGRRDRLEVVKEVASKFIEARKSDRIGLVGFARYPDLVCPLTLDHQALLRFLEPLEFKNPRGPEDGTGIGAGLALCVQQLEKTEAKSHVVILLTDGQENVGYVSPEEAGKLASDKKVRVYSIGAGKGMRDPFFGRVQKPDFSVLNDFAKKTGGEFFEAEDEKALRQIFDRIDKLEKSELQDPVYLADELFEFSLLLGLLAIFLSLLLRVGVLVEVP